MYLSIMKKNKIVKIVIPLLIISSIFIMKSTEIKKIFNNLLQQNIVVEKDLGKNTNLVENEKSNINYDYQVIYTTYNNFSGWTDLVADGKTSGNGNKLEWISGIKIFLNNKKFESDSIIYKVDNIGSGWEDWKTEGMLSGLETTDGGFEGIAIDLTGNTANNFDIYYRVCVENIGWLDWAKNGDKAGTEGKNFKIIGIQMVLTPKGAGNYVSTRTYVKYKPIELANPLNVPIIKQRPELPTGCEITSLTMMFRYLGENVTKLQIAKEIPYNSTNPNIGFQGSPYTKTGFTIYPPALTEVVKKYAGSAKDLTGTGLNGIKTSIDQGKPVVVWVRMNGFYLHVVLITGYTKFGFYYNDPWTGKKNNYVTKSVFSTAWDILGQKAISY